MIRRLAIFAAAALAAPAFAQTDTAAPASPAPSFPPAPAIAPLEPFTVPASETYALANGMRVTLVPFGAVPKTTVSLRVYAGNIDDGQTPWIADITGDMLKEGAGARTSDRIASDAAEMGGGLSVGVNMPGTTIGMNVLADRAADAVALIGDVARRPTFPASEFDRVKANKARELALGLSQAQTMANVALARAYYGTDHPYGRIVPTSAQLAGYTLDDAKRFHAANFGAKRAHLFIAGRFDAAAVKAAVESAFGDWAAGPARTVLPSKPKPGPQVVLVDRPGAPQSTIRLAWPAAPAGSAGEFPLDVGDALLAGAFSSRITTNIRESKGYTYSPGSSVQSRPGETAWVFNADVTTAVTGASLKEIFGEIRRLQGEAPGAEEATGMKTYNAGIFIFRNSTAPLLVGTLAEADMLGLPPSWISGYIPATLAVTPVEMQTWAKTLPIDKATLVVVGDLKTVVPQLKAQPELANAEFRTVTVP